MLEGCSGIPATFPQILEPCDDGGFLGRIGVGILQHLVDA